MSRKRDDLEIRLYRPGARRSHGRAILTLAVMGLFGCPVFGVSAWIWARRELARIRTGESDPVDEGRVRAAMILGLLSMVHLVMVAGGVAAVMALVAAIAPGNLRQALDLLKELTSNGRP